MVVRPLPRTIGGLAIAAALTIGIVTSLLGLLTYAVVHEEIERQIDHRIELETDALLAYHRRYGLAALAEIVRIRDGEPSTLDTGYLAGVDDADRTMGHIVTDATGVRLVDTLGSRMPPPGWSEFLEFRKSDGSSAIAQATNSALPGGGRLVVAADRSIVDQMDLAILKLFLIAFTVILAVGAVTTIGLGRVVRRRLNAIETDAGAIIAGDLTRRMALDGSDGEFDRLARVLNRMLDRIGDLVVSLRQVSSDIAHDMRLPLTRLRRSLELAQEAPAIQAKTHVAEASEAADDLLELFSALLAISEIEGHSARKRFAPVAWDEATREIVEAYGPALADAGKTIAVRTEPVNVVGDRRLLQQSVANLLDNFLAHTPSGSHLVIALYARGDRAALRFADDGPGVPPEDHERVFERLTRLDRSRSSPGHGLGLNMVMAITRTHAGAVGIVPSDRGLVIEMVLPLAEAVGSGGLPERPE